MSAKEVDSKRLNSQKSLPMQIFTESAYRIPEQGIGYLMTRDIENQGYPKELMELLRQTTEKVAHQDFALAAADFAIELFQDTRRKDGLGTNGDGTPYDRHLLRTAVKIQNKTALNVAIALLHDAREDIPELTEEMFRERMTILVEKRAAESGKEIPKEKIENLIKDTYEATGYLSDNIGRKDGEKIRKDREQYYQEIFKMDELRPDFCLLEIKIADREDNMISDVGMIQNGKGNENTRKNLKNAIRKAEELLAYIKYFRPEQPGKAARLLGVITEAKKAVNEPEIIFLRNTQK